MNTKIEVFVENIQFFFENFWKGVKTAQCTAHSVQVVKLFGATVCAMPPNAT